MKKILLLLIILWIWIFIWFKSLYNDDMYTGLTPLEERQEIMDKLDEKGIILKTK